MENLFCVLRYERILENYEEIIIVHFYERKKSIYLTVKIYIYNGNKIINVF